ncbi:MAG: 4-hydroxy-3-methylbut-2-enyl diphosphate reductase, partial [Candidatus Marinimicrobia bacterium]|nr:4-hydroxy-3-methylbut-2-enyl diphosphate reductase [Candidatus Neomarinimicrobiota bacterium]
AHGTEQSVVQHTLKNGIKTIDATCPLVKRIHDEVRNLADEGRSIIIVGDQGHEEVLGIASQVEKAIIVSHPDDAKKIEKLKSIGVVTQSTQTSENVKAIIDILFDKTQDLRIINTICPPTTRNQNEVKRISQENDIVIVIGSKTSANTKRLLSVSQKYNKRSYMISGPEEIDKNWFKEGDKVGVTAGASTPDEMINAAISIIREL